MRRYRRHMETKAKGHFGRAENTDAQYGPFPSLEYAKTNLLHLRA
jgi:hypothetical protein